MVRLVRVAILGCVLVALPEARAVPVDITVSGGALVVAAPKSDLGNFGDGTVFSWLTSDVANYNSIEVTSLPAPTQTGDQTGLTSGAGGNSITLDLPGNYNYLFLHWGGQHGGWAQAFYLGNLAGDYTFDNSTIDGGAGNPAVGGLSSYSLIDDVPLAPDGGTTFVLLGTALSCLGLIRRRLN